MSISSIKKILLAGTALVAVAAFGAQAQATEGVLTGATTWGETTGTGLTTPNTDNGIAVVTGATTTGYALTITNDGTAFDGTATSPNHNSFTLGAITDSGTTQVGSTVTINSGSANNLAVTIASVGFSGSTTQGAFTVQNTNNGANNVAVTVTGAFVDSSSAAGANLVLTNADTTASAVSMSIGTTASINGTTTITAGAAAGAATTTLSVGSSATFVGATTITGGTNAAAVASLNLNGGVSGFTGGLTLTNGAAGHAGLNLNGTSAQSVAGTIGGTGDIIIDNTGATTGATLSGAVTAGSITIDKGGASGSDSIGTFQNTVTAPITLGAAAGTVNGVTFGTATAGDVNTVVFDGTTTGFTVTGAIAGANSVQTNNISVIGSVAHTIVQATASTANLNNLSINGASGTQLTSAANLTVANTTIASGNILDTTGGTLTSTVVDTGTLQMGGGAVTGNVSGAGLLNVTSNGTLTGNLSTTTGTIGNTITLQTSGNITGTAFTGGNSASTLELVGVNTASTPQVVSGTLATGTLQVGTGTSDTNATFSAAQASLSALNVEADASATFNAATTASGAFTSSGTSTFASGASSTGAITNTGTINVTGGSLTAGATAIANNAGTINLTGGSLTTTSSFTNTGATTVVIDTGKALNAGTVALDATADHYTFEVKGGTSPTNGLLNATTTANLTNAVIGVTVDPTSGIIANHTKFLVVTTGSSSDLTDAAITAAPTTAVATVGLDKFYAVTGSATPIASGALAGVTTGGNTGDVYLVAVQQSAAALGSAVTANDSALYSALSTISTTLSAIGSPTTAETQLATAITAVNTAAATSATAAHNALQALMPAGADGGAQSAALTVGAETQGLASTRLTSLRNGDDPTSGVAAGASANGVSMWLEGYGQHANQDTDDGVNGYSANTWGGAVGVDSSAIFDKAVVGFALNYGHSSIDSEDINSTNTTLGNYGLNVYGTYDLGDKMFVNGQVGFAYNTIDSDRYNVGGTPGLTAVGSTSSDQYSARIDAGRDYPAGGGLTLTPDLSAAYTYLDTAGYTETGAGGLDNTVASNSQNNLGLGIGGTASWKIADADDNVFKPALHAGYTYEAVDDKVQTSSSFAGDPASTIFINEGASPARSIFDVGAKLVYSTKANWDLSANYDFQVKQDYTSNTGEIRATAHF